LLQFQHKEFSWLFLVAGVLVLLFIGVQIWKKRTRKRIGDEKLVAVLTRDFSEKKFLFKFIMVAIAFVLGIIAVLNPGKHGGEENTQRKGIDIAIALDVSKSMLAADLAPNRLERAKQFIGKLMDGMKDDRIALVLFAGKAYMQMPLTTDHGAARLFVSAANPDAVPQQGTVISEALDMSVKAFNPADKRFKSIILISDGETHDENAVKTAKEFSEQGVMINTIGVGSVDGSVIIDPATGENKRDETGNTVISKLNEQVLRSVAEETNGVYINLQGSDEAVSVIKAQLSQIERKAFSDQSLMSFQSFYVWFAAAMFILLLLENLVPEKRKRTS
jgi:Ca-activated chloride channel homolog